jgi:hypothetical protein
MSPHGPEARYRRTAPYQRTYSLTAVLVLSLSCQRSEPGDGGTSRLLVFYIRKRPAGTQTKTLAFVSSWSLSSQ